MRTTDNDPGRRSLCHRLPALLLVSFLVSTLLTTACHSGKETHDVAVNTPASGIVRRVLVNEGGDVEKDQAIIEIAVTPESTEARPPGKTGAKQNSSDRAAQVNLAAAEGEVNRTTADLKRIEPLVKRGLASKAELDKARAQALDARERLEMARNKSHTEDERGSLSPTTEQIVTVRVPAAGTLRAVRVQTGQQVTAGQPVATLNSRT